jgi:hypothetical protein
MAGLSDQVSSIIEELDRRGCQVNPASRLGKMRRILCSSDGTPAEDIRSNDPHFNEALEAIRDVRQIQFILSQLGPLLDEPANADHLRKLSKDSVLPQDAKTVSVGRNKQAEMFVAAVCAKAGLQPQFDEPDIVIALSSERLGIAVKRLGSRAKFERNVRDAANQLQRQSLPGFVVVDTSSALNPENARVLRQLSDEEMRHKHKQHVEGLLDEHRHRMSAWVVGKGVYGLVLQDHQVRLHPQDGWSLDSLTVFVPIRDSLGRPTAEFVQFRTAYPKGLPSVLAS